MKAMVNIMAVVVLGATCVTSVLAADAAEGNDPQIQNGLKVSLSSVKEKYAPGRPVQLNSTFENLGKAEMSLTFWWNRRLRITDSQGKVVVPDKGRELPCGKGESPALLAPGKTISRSEPLVCTQPKGVEQSIGWKYKLKPGTYKIALVFEAPPTHGYSINSADNAWKGKVVSNEVTITIEE